MLSDDSSAVSVPMGATTPIHLHSSVAAHYYPEIYYLLDVPNWSVITPVIIPTALLNSPHHEVWDQVQ